MRMKRGAFDALVDVIYNVWYSPADAVSAAKALATNTHLLNSSEEMDMSLQVAQKMMNMIIKLRENLVNQNLLK